MKDEDDDDDGDDDDDDGDHVWVSDDDENDDDEEDNLNSRGGGEYITRSSHIKQAFSQWIHVHIPSDRGGSEGVVKQSLKN